MVSGSSLRRGKRGDVERPKVKPKALAPASDALTETGGSLVVVVMVAVESVNSRVDCAR